MGNKWKIWTLAILLAILVAILASIGIYAYHKGGVSDHTNVIPEQRLAEEEENKHQVSQNKTVETVAQEEKISPNAIVIEKRYYKACDHLIRKTVDVTEGLVNKTEEELQKAYPDWKIESFSSGEATVFKEFSGMCQEHYVVKENNGVLAIYTENSENVQEWQEDTEIEVQYLPEEDVEEFKVGVRVVGRTNLNMFLEDYE